MKKAEQTVNQQLVLNPENIDTGQTATLKTKETGRYRDQSLLGAEAISGDLNVNT